MQYSPDDLPIEKPAKTAVSQTSAFKAPLSSSRGTLEKDSDPIGQMIVNPTTLKAVNAQASPPRDVIIADPTVKAAHATFVVSRVKPDLAGKLASSEEI